MKQYLLAALLGTAISAASIFAATTITAYGLDRSDIITPVSFIDYPPTINDNLSSILVAYQDTDETFNALLAAQARTKPRNAKVDEINAFLDDITLDKSGLREVAVECRSTHCMIMIDADANQGEWLTALAEEMPSFGHENHIHAYSNLDQATLVMLTY